MAKNDFSDLGEQIKETVQKAMDSMDFAKLNEDITKTVGQAIDEVRRGVDGFQRRYMNDSGGSRRKEGAGSRQSRSQNFEQNQSREQKQTMNLQRPAIGKPKGRSAGVLYTVFGFLGAVPLGITNLVCLAGSIVGGVGIGLMATAIVCLPLFAGFTAMAVRGIYLNCRNYRFKQYVRKIGNRCVCTITELSRTIGKPEKYVTKDLDKMIGLGMFPEGHIDEHQTCLMLTDETYSLYRASMESMRQRREEEEYVKEQRVQNEVSEEMEKVIEAGEDYVRQIREANDVLEEAEISEKLQRLEDVIAKIFEYVELHPDKLSEISRFIDYYLPTTLKLVKAYEKFDTEPIQGENIRKSKMEIKQTLDTINHAFENLLDDLYEDIAMDISTDISVLQTMLAQEGLTGNDFKRNQ